MEFHRQDGYLKGGAAVPVQRIIQHVSVPGLTRQRLKAVGLLLAGAAVLSFVVPGAIADGSTTRELAATGGLSSTSACTPDKRHDEIAKSYTLTVRIPTTAWLCPTQDSSFARVYLQAGFTYTIETLHLSTYGDTTLSLLTPDGSAILATNSGQGGKGSSVINATIATSAMYVVKVARTTVSSNEALQYDVRVN